MTDEELKQLEDLLEKLRGTLRYRYCILVGTRGELYTLGKYDFDGKLIYEATVPQLKNEYLSKLIDL